ncbi:hypothetical protein AT15_07450 [Kosmotoga arenicorallina S304]|uniref:Exonuclease VII large subunit C-terminal domain-containing protein n=1 Tax=Kosmotoga arenicorallina S304 TaxID=1453497 RepID=A0A176K300_9BACT|nr:exodeoxyribonuclease VII large subunit [Kosmotoga arenicorallina]OAA31323.1 hypothetical protein AT15_07450 [Kosmotoga arenicorallina S304]
MKRQFQRVSELMWWIREFSRLHLGSEVEVVGEVRNARINRRGVLDLELVESSKTRSGNYTYRLNCQLADPKSLLKSLKIQSPKELEGLEYALTGNLNFRVTQNRYVLEAYEILPYGKGSIEKRRNSILKELEKDGLYPVKKLASLFELKEPITKISVIASPGTRGLTDFVASLSHSPLLPDILFYPTAMEGASAAEEICKAIESAQAQETGIQLIVILRGGGAQGSLLYFENEKLARTVCLSKIPVISAIGHTEDKTLLDYVASLSLETPTSAGREIAETNLRYLENLERSAEAFFSSFMEIIEKCNSALNQDVELLTAYRVGRYLSSYKREVDLQTKRLLSSISAYSHESEKALKGGYKELSSKLSQIFRGKRSLTATETEGIFTIGKKIEKRLSLFETAIREVQPPISAFLDKRKEEFKESIHRLTSAADYIFNLAQQHSREYTAKIRSINPLHSLLKGGAIATDALGKPLVTIEQVERGDELKLRITDGIILSEVKEKQPLAKKLKEGVK